MIFRPWPLLAFLSTAMAFEALQPHPKAVPNIHPPGVVDRPEMVKFIVSDPAPLPGIVVDETAAELVGEWQYSTHTPPYVGLGYLHDMKAGKGAKSVTFTPDLPKAGWYEVRLAHCYNVRRSTKTPVTIHHADGDTTVRINQQTEPAHDRLFRTLGTFRFAAGRKGWVRVSNDGTEPSMVVIADAVQFLPVARNSRAATASAARSAHSAMQTTELTRFRCWACLRASRKSRSTQAGSAFMKIASHNHPMLLPSPFRY